MAVDSEARWTLITVTSAADADEDYVQVSMGRHRARTNEIRNGRELDLSFEDAAKLVHEKHGKNVFTLA